MPLTRKVREITIPLSEYAVTRIDHTLKQAVPALRRLYCQVEDGKCTEAGHRTILVLDQAGALVGVLDFRSILKVLIPEVAGGLTARLAALEVSIAFAQAGATELDEANASFRARVIKNADTKVRDVMLKVRGTISADADIVEALRLLLSNRITMIPVYDGEQLIGVVRDSDLFLFVAEILAE
jgi:CBS domain-containing protein